MKININYREDTFWNCNNTFYRITDKLTVAISDLAKFDKETISTLRHSLSEAIKPFWGSMYVAECLKKKGYTLGIISNHSKFWFESLFQRFHMEDIFNTESLVIPSYLFVI